MIRDRGAIKWTAMMLPEHVQSIKEAINDEEKRTKPILEEDKIQEMELLLLEGLEFDLSLYYSVFQNGRIKTFYGRTTSIDHVKKELHIQDQYNTIHMIPFHTLVNIQT